MTDHFISDDGEGYPALMPLPDWVTNAVAKLTDRESLVLMECTVDDQPRLAVAHHSPDSGPADRTEFHPIAILLDTDLQDRLHFTDDSSVYRIDDS